MKGKRTVDESWLGPSPSYGDQEGSEKGEADGEDEDEGELPPVQIEDGRRSWLDEKAGGGQSNEARPGRETLPDEERGLCC